MHKDQLLGIWMWKYYWYYWQQEWGVCFCKRAHPNIYFAGCTLHLIHIAARLGAKVESHYFFIERDER